MHGFKANDAFFQAAKKVFLSHYDNLPRGYFYIDFFLVGSSLAFY